ncbi:ABC transporter substrate-binding protein [Lysinibacillus fusiformis]|uniref:ABC transporter substrate-binding protein n=1 Tax=Lysinibacillus fusiformis TaxID=28031 RepID=UPI002E1C44A1|nr:ABC transporter substrate-binding protein [Lysinibacillus fusiformis]
MKVKKKTSGIKLIVMVMIMVILAGCTPDSNEQSSGNGDSKSKNTLVISSVREPDTIDVHKTTWVDNSTANIYDTLLKRDLEGNIIPGLAEKYDISDDGKIWTFYLDENVRFHSGEPLTAEAVKKSFERFLEYSAVKFLAGPVDKMEADGQKLMVYFTEPFAPFASGLTTAYLAPMDPKALDEYGEDFGKKPSASGIFKFEERVRGSSITYMKNEGYNWGPPFVDNKGAPGFDQYEFRFITDDDTRVLEFKKGTTQIMTNVPPNYIKDLEATEGVKIDRMFEQGITYLGFNNKKPMFQDKRVRQAIALGINRDPLVEFALEGYAKPLFGPLPQSIPGYSEKVEGEAAQKYTQNVKKAKSLLEEAGWKDTNGDGIVEKDGKPFSFEIWLSDEPVMQRIVQILQGQLKEIGIVVNISVQEPASISANTPKGLHDAILNTYGWSDPDILYMLFGKGSSLRMHYEPEELHNLLTKARQTMDMEERMKIYEEAQQFLVEESPWVPLFVRENVTAYRDINGFKQNPYSQSIIFNDITSK